MAGVEVQQPPFLAAAVCAFTLLAALLAASLLLPRLLWSVLSRAGDVLIGVCIGEVSGRWLYEDSTASLALPRSRLPARGPNWSACRERYDPSAAARNAWCEVRGATSAEGDAAEWWVKGGDACGDEQDALGRRSSMGDELEPAAWPLREEIGRLDVAGRRKSPSVAKAAVMA